MMSTRIVGLSPALKRTTFQSSLVRNQAVLRNVILRRGIQTEFHPASKAQDVLNTQRLKRPVSPHMTIYQPQLTWYPSIINRVTGAALSALLYGFTISYVVLPYVGFPFTSTDVVQLVSTLPDFVKYTGKALLAAPFAFHSLNGIRHLAWDSGKFLSIKGVYSTGYAVIGASALATLGLLFV